MMKYFLMLILLFSSAIFASEQNMRTEQNIKAQIEKEKRFHREQQFYKGSDYDLKSAEVNQDSVKNLPEVENTYKGYDMTADYDDN